MNLYDTIQVKCIQCGRSIGEIEYDAELIRPKCGKCANPIPEGDDKLMYTINALKQ